MFSQSSYQRLFRFFCIYDVLALAPFAIPFINSAHIETLSSLNVALGGQTWPVFLSVQLLFGQMLGVLGTGWTIWRWRNFSVSIGRYEGILRLFFAASMLWAYALSHHPILLMFAVIDGVGGVLHLASPQRQQISQRTA
ncbi:hypothetical protein [Pseudovibrio sp. JE062]|uniref:hypothetical protein n=1 Tax=Pseudovibrio sp. JE062 TaxID=439495 RepID=UPI000186F507|nr:hypothetical protein [Pseudovibrio sp. JE062]EEA93367.1 conserved hypothetical protein [Pseudovibrio sp. JE062]